MTATRLCINAGQLTHTVSGISTGAASVGAVRVGRARTTAIRANGLRIAALAVECLHTEVNTFPKPGLVSHIDTGAHLDMDARLLHTSADALSPFFTALVTAGAACAGMDRLRQIGIAAERAMLAATGGVNTHRGAIFGLGLLSAAAGVRAASGTTTSLGRIVAGQWGRSIVNTPVVPDSHGARVARYYGVGGARTEAALGFPSIYHLAIPALATGNQLARDDAEAARVHACMALIASVADTNLLHRGGPQGLAFAQKTANGFLEAGSVGQPDWRIKAIQLHNAFVTRNLSPGGCADLLAMALFVQKIELTQC